MQNKCIIRALYTCAALTPVILTQNVWANEQASTNSSTTKDKQDHTILLDSNQISLSQAIEKALMNSPHIATATARLDAAKGKAKQAGYFPNPNIEIEAENFGGSGNFRGTNKAEISYGFSQKLEIGGKRTYRKKAASHKVTEEHLNLEIARLELIKDVQTAYNNAIASQEMLNLAREQKTLAEAMLKTVKKRVNSGSEPKIQQHKAEIGLHTANIAVGRLAREFEHAKHVLTSLWAGHNEAITLDNSEFFKLLEPKNESEVESTLLKSPDYEKGETSIKHADALYELERSNSIPDPKISLGVKDIRNSNDQAFMAGISFPLPVFNRNNGEIIYARNMLSKANSAQISGRIDRQNEAFEWLESLTNAYHEANSLKSQIIIAAEQSFKLARKGYRAGRFAYIDVLDAQRTLFETKEQYIKSLQQYHIALANLERLTNSTGK